MEVQDLLLVSVTVLWWMMNNVLETNAGFRWKVFLNFLPSTLSRLSSGGKGMPTHGSRGCASGWRWCRFYISFGKIDRAIKENLSWLARTVNRYVDNYFIFLRKSNLINSMKIRGHRLISKQHKNDKESVEIPKRHSCFVFTLFWYVFLFQQADQMVFRRTIYYFTNNVNSNCVDIFRGKVWAWNSNVKCHRKVLAVFRLILENTHAWNTALVVQSPCFFLCSVMSICVLSCPRQFFAFKSSDYEPASLATHHFAKPLIIFVSVHSKITEKGVTFATLMSTVTKSCDHQMPESVWSQILRL